jgi:methionine synthase II (cobalamin-independent)
VPGVPTGNGPLPTGNGPLPSGIGSLPGTDPAEAARVVAGELPELPHVPELPERGPGADLVGRTAARLVDLHVDRTPSGWRLVPRPGVHERRAVRWFADDVDATAEALAGRTGPVTLAVCGPWTLAASLARPRGGPVLADPGAVRDLVDSLVETVAAMGRDLARVVDGGLVIQLDEPSLPAVLAGAVPTESGLGRLAAVDPTAARDTLTRVVDGARTVADTVTVHCCAARPPVRLLRETGVDGVSVDVTQLLRDGAPADGGVVDEIGVAVEAGRSLWAGALPTAGPYDAARAADTVRALWHVLGLEPARLAQVVLTPACGLAGRSWPAVTAAYRAARQAARRLGELAGAGSL